MHHPVYTHFQHLSTVLLLLPTVRDYTNELMEAVTLRDPNFQPHHLMFWNENVTMKAPPTETSFATVDSEIDKLDKNARESAFRQDCLKLARDCAQLAQLYKMDSKHERGVKLQKSPT